VNYQVFKPARVEPSQPWWKVAAIAIVCAIALSAWQVWGSSSNPYVDRVLEIQGDPLVGNSIFLTNCAGCHAHDASGEVGPSLHDVSRRKSSRALIEQVTGGNTPPMPQFKPSANEMADLLSYLQTL
jgi:mono/diheme cytochrome c family protein